MTYDLCLAPARGPKGAVAQRLLAFTDPDAAEAVARAVNDHAADLFQADGLEAVVVTSDRSRPAGTSPPLSEPEMTSTPAAEGTPESDASAPGRWKTSAIVWGSDVAWGSDEAAEPPGDEED